MEDVLDLYAEPYGHGAERYLAGLSSLAHYPGRPATITPDQVDRPQPQGSTWRRSSPACLNRRIEDEASLKREIAALETERNQAADEGGGT